MNNFSFVKNPNLPQNNVAVCIIGEDNKLTKEFLNSFKISILETQKTEFLDVEIQTHADVLCSYLGNGNFVLPQNQHSLKKSLFALGARVEEAEKIPSSPYPNDILLNHTILGNRLICNVKNTSTYVLNFAKEKKLDIINVKQGYSKCSICVVADNAIITEDSGIERLLKNYQIDVLKIKGDFIKLSNNHFGFLGGASGKLGPNIIYFNGNLREHPDYNEILKFLNKYNVEPIFDTSYSLTDIGSILPIMEFKS